MIGVLLKSLIKKEVVAKALPIAKKVLLDVSKEYVQGAAKTAGEKSVRTITKAPQKVEEFVDKKKSEFLDEAESKAEKVFSEQMEILDQRIDTKVIEIEKKFDEKIKAVFLLFIVSMFVIMVLAGLTFSLIFRYFNF